MDEGATAPANGARDLELRARHINYLMGLIPEQMDRAGWTRPRIEEAQLAALRAMLSFAKERSPWYRERLAGMNTDTVTLADLETIPVLTKRELMEHWDEIVTVPGISLKETEAFIAAMEAFTYFRNECVALASSGTSGLAGVFLYDWHSWAMNHAAMLRSTLPLILQYSQQGAISTASVSANAPTHFSSMVSQCFSPPGNEVVRLPISLPVAEIVSRLNRARPTFLHCFPSYIRILALEAAAGRLDIAPKIIFCTSEPLSGEDEKIARDIWGCHVLSSWSTSETVGTTPCLAGSGFHILEDLNIIEGIGGAETADGEGWLSEGILITNLYNFSLPLIRYEISDRFEFSRKACGCGSHFAHVSRVHGRVDELFFYGDVVVHPGVLESAFAEDQSITDYQFNQTANGVDVLLVSPSRLDVEKIRGRLVGAIAELGLAQPDVRVSQVDGIERSKLGKARRSVALGARV